MAPLAPATKTRIIGLLGHIEGFRWVSMGRPEPTKERDR